MDIHRGGLFWVEAPDPDGQAVIPHPHLVVQDDLFNQSRIETVVVCPLTSNLKRAKEPGSVLLDPGEGALERQSVVLASRITALPKDRLGAYIGTLTPARVDQVLAALRFVQSSFLRGR